MKSIIFLLILSAFSTGVAAQKETDYSNWLFMQSDKSLQYRMAEVKKEGDFSYFQLQFRVKADDEVHCKNAMCEGLLLYLSHDNIEKTETVKYYFLFDKSFEGDNKTYSMKQLIPVELKTWPDGSKRYFTKDKGIVYTQTATGEKEFQAQVLNICVDIRIKNQPGNHRCTRNFKPEEAVVVQ